MLEAMIQDADGGDVTLRTLAKTFIRRNKESRAAGAPRLGLKLWFIAVLQAVGGRELQWDICVLIRMLIINSNEHGTNGW
jgi:hypothetical protein